MKTYILAVESVPASVESAKRMQDACVEHGINNAEMFYGVDAFNAESYMKEQNIEVKIKHAKPHNGGTLGCFSSHHTFWRMCVEQNEPFMILEHDGKVVRSIPEDLDWEDVLELDPFRYDPKLTEPAGITDHYYRYPRPYLGEWYCLAGTYGYAIKPHAAQKLLDATDKVGMLVADHMISRAFVRIQKIIPVIVEIDKTWDTSLTNSKSNQYWSEIKK